MSYLTYERPEFVEIGDAEKLTLGCRGSCSDSCDCAQCRVAGCGSEILAGTDSE